MNNRKETKTNFGVREDTRDLRQCWEVLLYYKWSIGLVVLIFFLVTLIISLRMTPLYTSSTRLLQVESKGQLTFGNNNVPEFTPGYEIETMAQLPKTRPVLETVINKLNLKIKPEGLAGMVTIGWSKETKIITIWAKYPDPIMAQKIAGTLAEAAIREELGLHKLEAEAKHGYLINQLARVEENLDRTEEKMKEFEEEERVIDIDKRKGPTQFSEQALSLVRAEEHLNLLEEESQAELVAADARVKKFEEELGLKEINYEVFQEGEEKEPGPVQEALLIEYIKQKTEISAQKAKVENFRGGKKRIWTRMKEVPEKQLSLARLERKRQINEQYFLSLKEKLEETRLGMESEVGNLRVIEPPEMPAKPNWPNIPINILISLVIGVMSGVGLAFLRDYLDSTIKSLEAIEEHFTLPSLGHIPFLAKDKRLIDIQGSHPGITEIYSPISHELNRIKGSPAVPAVNEKERGKNSFLITSTVAGEGKSTTALNLALASSMEGNKVILLEADMRSPSGLTMTMGLPVRYGLQDYLMDKASLEEVLIETKQPNLKLLPARKNMRDDNWVDLLNSTRMKELIERLKQEADILYIDSPAILPVFNISSLVKEIDGVIFIVKAHGPKVKAVNFALERLSKINAPLMGTLLTKVRVSKKDIHYYYSYCHAPVRQRFRMPFNLLKKNIPLGLPSVRSILICLAILFLSIFYLANPGNLGLEEGAEAKETVDFGMRNAECGMRIYPDPKSEIRNPKSEDVRKSEIQNQTLTMGVAYAIQIGSETSLEAAGYLQNRAFEAGFSSYQQAERVRQPIYRIFIGKLYPAMERAEEEVAKVRAMGYETRVDTQPNHHYIIFLGEYPARSEALELVRRLEADSISPRLISDYKEIDIYRVMVACPGGPEEVRRKREELEEAGFSTFIRCLSSSSSAAVTQKAGKI
ncbi:MAG: GNVR domain-containing protein [bacterium]|nr:GNVR domain-containing protein [bacterium]